MKEKFGYMSCEGCNVEGKKNRVLVRQKTETGTLSYSCDECDSTEYAAKGQSVKYARWLKNIERIAPAAPVAKPHADPKPADPKPAPAAKKGAGLLLG